MRERRAMVWTQAHSSAVGGWRWTSAEGITQRSRSRHRTCSPRRTVGGEQKRARSGSGIL